MLRCRVETHLARCYSHRNAKTFSLNSRSCLAVSPRKDEARPIVSATDLSHNNSVCNYSSSFCFALQ